MENLLTDGDAGASEALAAATESIHDLLAWHADMTRMLESTAFVARLEQLPPELAVAALDEVEQLKYRLRALRFEALFRHGATGVDHEWRTVRAELETPLLRVLQLVGIEPRSIERSESGLRELTIASTTPKVRVLFGLDPVHRRLVAILGEPLTRSYYGDSVRVAERRWAGYRAEQESAHIR